MSERGRERERGGEKQRCVRETLICCLSHEWACNPGMCPDRELNQQPFGLQADTQSTEPHQPGQSLFFLTAHIQFTLSLPYFRPPSFIGTSAMSSLSVFQFINLIGNFLCTHYTLVFIPNLCLCPHYFLHRKALLFPLIFT